MGAYRALLRLYPTSFRAEYGEDPDFYAANYYEITLGMWEIIRRVLAKGVGSRPEHLDRMLAINPPELGDVTYAPTSSILVTPGSSTGTNVHTP